MTITSVMNHGYNISHKIGYNICLISIMIHGGFIHLPPMAITSAIQPYFMGKNIFPYTFSCYKICRENIFFRPEAAHSSEQKLV